MKDETKNSLIKLLSISIVWIGVIVILLCCLFFTGCVQGEKVNDIHNAHVEFLFEQDGVKVYRFYDKMRYRYFCTGEGRYLPSDLEQGDSKHKSYYSDGAF